MSAQQHAKFNCLQSQTRPPPIELKQEAGNYAEGNKPPELAFSPASPQAAATCLRLCGNLNLRTSATITISNGINMAFLMEKMIDSDHAKIFSPANIQLMEQYCAANEEWEPMGENRWAIDRQRDVIFMFIPITISDVCLYYALVLKGSLIVIQKDSRNHIKPLDIPAHLQVQKDEIEQMIREAFMVHGYYGITSPKHAVDIPCPIFE